MHDEIANKGLYCPQLESDACGIGLITNFKNNASHSIIDQALVMLENMEHRGGEGNDASTGDGAGILIHIPHNLYFEEVKSIGLVLPDPLEYATGLIFVHPSSRSFILDIVENEVLSFGFKLIGLRNVKTNSSILGESSKATEPDIVQIFIEKEEEKLPPKSFESILLLLRQRISKAWYKNGFSSLEAHICSLSCRTIVYKGYLTSGQLRQYYYDLQDERTTSALALIHSRYSTNTIPSWHLAQPFRFVAHNGEINTIQGNLNSWHARENEIISRNKSFEDAIFPVIDYELSDSGNLDRIIEFFARQGKSLPEIMMMLIPEAYQNDDYMPQFKKDFYEFNEYVIEPWEGPASLVFTDGVLIGACLDRNGLRPSRYYITDDDCLILASECGCLPISADKILTKERLQPGKILIADLEEGRIINDMELKRVICKRVDYESLLSKFRIHLKQVHATKTFPESTLELVKRQIAAGYSKEDIKLIVSAMANRGKENISSMGSDIPLAVLSSLAQPIYNYFKQEFAQVTNPPIDPIRESYYMSLECSLGKIVNFFDPLHSDQQIIRLKSPILRNKSAAKIVSLDHVKLVDITYNFNETTLAKAIKQKCAEVVSALEHGNRIIYFSDHLVDECLVAIPSLLIVGAVHHFLIEKGLRKHASLVISAGDIIETHHIASLLSFGADAIHPSLAIASARDLFNGDSYIGEKNYLNALEKGLLKIMSKLGIATVVGYKGAQTFEALGLADEVINLCFRNTISRIGGMTFDMLEKEALKKHEIAFVHQLESLEDLGLYQWKSNGEYHLFNPKSVHLLRNSCRLNKPILFKQFSKEINEQENKHCTLRSLLEFKKQQSIPLSEVEPASEILKRFATGAMSFGSLSHEAHSTLAIAMNRIGGKSNSGEGGEDPIRYELLPNGDSMSSAIKQVASGRFGVTAEYLANAKEIQIKMAQGAKPGEGGQLPGFKVDEWIGRVRHANPGTELISPPPHHDIYSIEDLAQLIFDLKNANPAARISVKLVSKAGVGIIASGVAKAKAEHILISGFDGGTGASPLSSIRHAGIPWELGVSETHQLLMANKLRDRVVIQADGQLRTARDLAIATLLGAEEWGISTAALVVEGCILLRKCHLNTCSVGIATQDPDLRKKFDGKVEDLVNYFNFLANDLREIMAELGFRTINEMVGRSDVLKQKENNLHWKASSVDLSKVLHKVSEKGCRSYQCKAQDFGLDSVLDQKLLKLSTEAINTNTKTQRKVTIKSTDRAVGALLSSAITRKYGAEGMPDESIAFSLRGFAGQSFGAFATKGIQFTLEGEANDYFGKGLSGAELIVFPDRHFNGNPQENAIIGNVAFYGATNGTSYINGKAGERFCVRNSGAEVVVESIGDNGCEYMTGGTVIILGKIGKNFGAGMSGGQAFIYSPEEYMSENMNPDMVYVTYPTKADYALLKRKLSKHFFHTGSKKALALLNNWENKKSGFIKIEPLTMKQEEDKVENSFIPNQLVPNY